MAKIGLVFGIPLAILALTGILVVDVREGGPEGHHIVLPVPMLLAEAALCVMPQDLTSCGQHGAHHMRASWNVGFDDADSTGGRFYREGAEAAKYMPMARALLRDLRRYPDFTLVEVRDGSDHVLVRKAGRFLTVDVNDGQDEVHCRVPLRMADRILASMTKDGRPRPRAIAGALLGLPHGDLVRVRSADGDQVRITRL
jgi:hypothetical protein